MRAITRGLLIVGALFALLYPISLLHAGLQEVSPGGTPGGAGGSAINGRAGQIVFSKDDGGVAQGTPNMYLRNESACFGDLCNIAEHQARFENSWNGHTVFYVTNNHNGGSAAATFELRVGNDAGPGQDGGYEVSAISMFPDNGADPNWAGFMGIENPGHGINLSSYADGGVVQVMLDHEHVYYKFAKTALTSTPAIVSKSSLDEQTFIQNTTNSTCGTGSTAGTVCVNDLQGLTITGGEAINVTMVQSDSTHCAQIVGVDNAGVTKFGTGYCNSGAGAPFALNSFIDTVSGDLLFTLAETEKMRLNTSTWTLQPNAIMKGTAEIDGRTDIRGAIVNGGSGTCNTTTNTGGDICVDPSVFSKTFDVIVNGTGFNLMSTAAGTCVNGTTSSPSKVTEMYWGHCPAVGGAYNNLAFIGAGSGFNVGIITADGVVSTTWANALMTVPVPLHATSTKTVGTCNLSGNPATCTATVNSGAKCVCSSDGTTAATIFGIGCSVSGTTMTATSASLTDSSTITYICL